MFLVFLLKTTSKTTHKLQKGVLHENAGRFLYKC
nr:MAG TPA: ApaLI-like restriction endonuclease [Caudoviricetes sp.]